MADMERVDMGSQAETSSSSKRDMGSYSSTMKPSDVKALTHRYNIPRDLIVDYPEGNVITMSEYLRLPFLSGMTIEAGRALTAHDVIPQHTTPPLSSDEPIPAKTDSQRRVEASDPKIVATRVRKAQAAAKRKAGKHKGSEGTSGPEKGSKRRKEQATDHIPCPTPLQTIEGVASDASRGENNKWVLGTGDDDFDDGVDEEIDLEGPERHVNDTTERVVLDTESIPPVATRPDTGKSIAQEETPMPDPLLRGWFLLCYALFVPTWGIHQRSRVTTPEECRDLMANLTPPGVQEEMHLLDNNIVLDRAWFTLARGAMAQAHALRLLRGHYFRPELYNTLSERNRNSARSKALRIKDLPKRDSAIGLCDRIYSDRLSVVMWSSGAQLAFVQKGRRLMAVKKILPLWLGRPSTKSRY
ncbi:hypothetical protein Tco_0276409 [Tanacetum coccineum]